MLILDLVKLGFRRWRRSGSWRNSRICRRILLRHAAQVPLSSRLWIHFLLQVYLFLVDCWGFLFEIEYYVLLCFIVTFTSKCVVNYTINLCSNEWSVIIAICQIFGWNMIDLVHFWANDCNIFFWWCTFGLKFISLHHPSQLVSSNFGIKRSILLLMLNSAYLKLNHHF